MTYRELQEYLARLTTNQLDDAIVVEVGDEFYRLEDGLNLASGQGDYLYKNEVYLSAEKRPISTKDFAEE